MSSLNRRKNPMVRTACWRRAGRVFCIPASDEADEITAAMLAQLLEQAGYASIAFSMDPSLQQAVELMDPAGERHILHFVVTPVRVFPRQNSKPATATALSRNKDDCRRVGISRRHGARGAALSTLLRTSW